MRKILVIAFLFLYGEGYRIEKIEFISHGDKGISKLLRINHSQKGI